MRKEGGLKEDYEYVMVRMKIRREENIKKERERKEVQVLLLLFVSSHGSKAVIISPEMFIIFCFSSAALFLLFIKFANFYHNFAAIL